jgi:lipopolysaccharide transport system ATP-binding protein
MATAIKVENLSKAYQLGKIGTGTVSRDLERWWMTKIRGKEDPFLKIGQTNDRTVKGTSDIVWSLKDINFEIEQGTAVGIIGRNGAGKSTLLKLLSRVTAPTTGNIKVKGRVASLLEVGTGFHPELTGKENIYLNGAILGMRRKEIQRKFDEIVDFSGVERYIDTPVKRYSSGMYVRLAFAVAAHLESEILIVDEVLAVGDAEFQKKCLGKMGEVSKGEGRTVLFVSHNLAAVKTLCTHGIILENGTKGFDGDSQTAIGKYLASSLLEDEEGRIPDDFYRMYKQSVCKFTNFNMMNMEGIKTNCFMLHETMNFEIVIDSEDNVDGVTIAVIINAFDGEPVVYLESLYQMDNLKLNKGLNKIVCSTSNNLLAGIYSITLNVFNKQNGVTYDYIDRAFELTTLNTSAIHQHYRWTSNQGLVYGEANWEIK